MGSYSDFINEMARKHAGPQKGEDNGRASTEGTDQASALGELGEGQPERAGGREPAAGNIVRNVVTGGTVGTVREHVRGSHLRSGEATGGGSDQQAGEKVKAFGSDSLRATDEASAAVQRTPYRVTLESILEKIRHIEYITPATIQHMTIAVVHMENGFCFVGSSTPADPENYNVELGQQFAREHAIRQIWPHEGYLLREVMSL